ncbi:hypothetical protein F5Y11DRAFT_363408 [Daldinia sp. FL1419]|nr:hypothetical protein F5Y11DRAFT_363408 [Daldinia sp. FL1419]
MPDVDIRESNIREVNMDEWPLDSASQLQPADLTNNTHRHVTYDYHWEDPVLDNFTRNTWQRWDDAGHLAQMALYVTIGIRKRLRGLRLFQLDDRPSLLELAPAIWNAHYLKAVTCHAANIPIISAILAASQNRSSSLREKSQKLLAGIAPSGSPLGNRTNLNTYQYSIQRRLWDLVQARLEPTIRIKSANLSVGTRPYKNIPLSFETMSADTGFLGFEDSDYFYVPDETMGENFEPDNTYTEYRSLYQYLGPPIGEHSAYSEVIDDYEQWQHMNQDIGSTDGGSPFEDVDAIKVESDSLPDSSFREDLAGFSNSSEPRGPLIIPQNTPYDSSASTMDTSDLHTSNYPYNVEDICDYQDDLPYNTRNTFWNDIEQHMYEYEDDYSAMTDQGVMDEDYELNETQAYSQDINTHEQY